MSFKSLQVFKWFLSTKFQLMKISVSLEFTNAHTKNNSEVFGGFNED